MFHSTASAGKLENTVHSIGERTIRQRGHTYFTQQCQQGEDITPTHKRSQHTTTTDSNKSPWYNTQLTNKQTRTTKAHNTSFIQITFTRIRCGTKTEPALTSMWIKTWTGVLIPTRHTIKAVTFKDFQLTTRTPVYHKIIVITLKIRKSKLCCPLDCRSNTWGKKYIYLGIFLPYKTNWCWALKWPRTKNSLH